MNSSRISELYQHAKRSDFIKNVSGLVLVMAVLFVFMNTLAPLEKGETYGHRIFGALYALSIVVGLFAVSIICIRLLYFALKPALRFFFVRVILASAYILGVIGLSAYGFSWWQGTQPTPSIFSADWFLINAWMVVGAISAGIEFTIAGLPALEFSHQDVKTGLKAIASIFIANFLFYALWHLTGFTIGMFEAILLAFYHVPVWHDSHLHAAEYLMMGSAALLMLPFWYLRVLVDRGRITRLSVLNAISNFNDGVATVWNVLVASAVGLYWIAVSIVLAGLVDFLWPFSDWLPLWSRALAALLIVGYPFGKGFAKVINVLRDRAELANEYTYGDARLATETEAIRAARGEAKPE